MLFRSAVSASTATGSPLAVDAETAGYWRIIGHCAPFNLTGHPALVVPLGRDANGLPMGTQVVGARWGEGKLLAIGALIERVTGPIGSPAEP